MSHHRLWMALAGLLAYTGLSFASYSITIVDPKQGSRTIQYEKINEFAVTEGDIIIGRFNHLHLSRAVILPKVGGKHWAKGVVPFELSEELPFMSKLAALEAITYLQQKTNIEFIELTSKNRSLYPDYLSFAPAPGTTCSSYVGRLGGKQEVNLAPRCNSMNTVHEICHALGLWHEQSRADRDQFIRIVWENIDEEHRFNFEQHLSDGEDYGEYDYQSIMHYPSHAFSKNGNKTIIPLAENVEIGQRERLSEKDIAAINAVYPEVGG